jgi:hypothetical protein
MEQHIEFLLLVVEMAAASFLSCGSCAGADYVDMYSGDDRNYNVLLDVQGMRKQLNASNLICLDTFLCGLTERL